MRHRILKLLVVLCRIALAGLFLFAAGAKLATFNEFTANLTNLIEDRWVTLAAVAIVVFEIATAALLLWPRTVRLGAVFSASLLLAFAGYALYYVYVLHGEPLECGCFGGIIASQLGVSTALRNLVLLVPALIVLFGHRKASRT